jgi:hypothetical protein
MNKCVHKDCSNKKKYGEFCYKHRNMFLLDTNNNIILNNYTYNKKDYNKVDMINLLIKYYDKKQLNKLSKNELFIKFNDRVINLINYNNNISKIILLQSAIRRYLIYKLVQLRGEGYLNKNICKNDEDFLFMTNIKEIENDYFFSYKDNLNNVWFFDIRSFIKLINDSNKLNPYTREEIDISVQQRAIKLMKVLNNKNICTVIEEYNPTSIILKVKQRVVDLFLEINTHGFNCNVDWFLNLTLHKLKLLYRSFEDIWNYRAQLSNLVKCNISPPHGILCPISILTINNISLRHELQNIILQEVERFKNAISTSDTKLGYIYFLVALGEVEPRCLESNPFLAYI